MQMREKYLWEDNEKAQNVRSSDALKKIIVIKDWIENEPGQIKHRGKTEKKTEQKKVTIFSAIQNTSETFL